MYFFSSFFFFFFSLKGNGILTSEELDEFKNNDVDLSLLEGGTVHLFIYFFIVYHFIHMNVCMFVCINILTLFIFIFIIVAELKDDFDGTRKKRKDILHKVSEYCQAFESNIKNMGTYIHISIHIYLII
jgi:hypothetical protein